MGPASVCCAGLVAVVPGEGTDPGEVDARLGKVSGGCWTCPVLFIWFVLDIRLAKDREQAVQKYAGL